MIGWRSFELGDVCTLRGGTAFKPTLQGRENGDYPFIKVSDFNSLGNECYINGANHWVDEADLPLIQGRPHPAGATVFAKIGEALKHNRKRLLTRPTFADNNLMVAVPKAEWVTPEYLFHLFRTIDIAASDVGTAVPYVKASTLQKLPVLIPPLDTQRRIAVILGAYDDLIEVNRRRVAVLEEMARGLFEELLKRPIQGNTIGELCEGSLGGDWGAEEKGEEHDQEVRVVRGTDIPRLQAGDFTSCPSRFITSKSAAKRLLQKHDLVLENSINAKTRPAGTTLLVTAGLLDELGSKAIAASFCRVFKFSSPHTALLVHHYCRHLHRTREIERFQTVAANGIANFQTQVFLKDCRLPIDLNESAAQVSLLESMHETGSLIGRQSSRLSASRDLLLPRLISGQLSVEAAERELEDAT